MTRMAVLDDEMWERIEAVLPPVKGRRGRPTRDHRVLVEGAIYRYRTGVVWRDLPTEFGPWQRVWKRHHRFSTDGTWDKVLTALQVQADARGGIDWRVSVDSTSARVHQHGATAARSQGGAAHTQGARSNDKDPSRRCEEPADHAIGRSRGGLRTKTHALVDGNGLPLVIALSPGRANDSPALPKLLAELRVPRVGPGRPRVTPLALRADKAYSARGHRAHLRARGITAVIPEPSEQIRHRKNKGSRGGRPVAFDSSDYKNRNVVERAFNHIKNWRAWPPATTSTPWSTAAESSSPRSCSGWHEFRDAP